ncbi:MAG: hypothetical protein QW734_07055 [Candidatus Bathyarchaeia archaeon]
MRETEYILFYACFVGFLILIISMGAPSFLSGEGMQELERIRQPVTITPPEYIESFPCQGWGIFEGVCNAIYGFIRVLWNIGVFFFWMFKTIGDGITTFVILFKFSSPVRWITLVLLTPMTIVLLYVVMRLFRGGG